MRCRSLIRARLLFRPIYSLFRSNFQLVVCSVCARQNPVKGRFYVYAQHEMKHTYIKFTVVVVLVASSWGGYHAIEWQRMRDAEVANVEKERANLEKLHQLMLQWDDIVHLAMYTPRDQLLGPIAKLQEIKRSISPLWFSCGPMETSSIVHGMDQGIGAFLYHMQQGSGKFDSSNLSRMEERIKYGIENLSKACGY